MVEVVRRGAGPTVVAFGPMLSRTLAPLAALAGPSPDVVVVEPWYEGSGATAITRALGHLPARYRFVGLPRAFVHAYGTWADLDAELGVDVAGIRGRLGLQP